MKKLLSILALLTVMVSTIWAGTDYKNGDVLYFDLSAVTTANFGCNILVDYGSSYSAEVISGSATRNSSNSDYFYNCNAPVLKITFTQDQRVSTSKYAIKTSAGGWTGAKFTDPTSGQNLIKVNADGMTYSWGTYGSSDVTPPTAVDYTIYFKNTVGWSNVYVHFYNASYSMGSNGASGSNAAANKGAMTKIDDGPYYKLEFTSTTAYTKVCFTKDQQDGHGNFWQTEASYSDALDLAGENLLYVPDKSNSTTKNSNVPYYKGTWKAYPEVAEVTYTVTLTNATEASVEAGESGTTITAAAAATGYKFKEWIGSDGITFGNATSATTTVHATQAGTAEATYVEKTNPTFYFWNTDNWEAVSTHRWGGTASSTSWPGELIPAPEYYSDGYGVYKLTFEEGAYSTIIFNNNNNGKQTDDLAISGKDGQCYKGKDGGWQALPEENWEVTISAENGTVSDAKKYVNATEVTVTAEPTAGYVFDRWEATGGVAISSSDETSATITANAVGTLKAIFKADVTKFAINFSAEGGTVAATVGGNAITTGAQYTAGESVDVIFSAAATGSNTFYGWYDGENNKVSEENPYIVSGITENYTIKALYAGDFYLKHPWDGGSWTVKQLTFDPATSLYYIYAYYGNDGFDYGTTSGTSSWNDNKQTKVGNPAKHDWCYITTNTSGAITVTKVTETHQLSIVGEHVTPNILVHGAAATEAHHMESAIFSATIADGYKFDGWYADAELQNLLSDAAEYTVERVTEDVVLYAKTVVEQQYTITIKNNVNTTETTMLVGETAKALTAAEIAKTLTAEEIALYAFTDWTVEGDAEVADLTAASTTITTTGAATVTANYELKHYYIKHDTWNSDGGWDWKEADQFENGTFSLITKYGASGCNWTDKADYSDSKYIGSPTLVGNPAKGDCCRFTLDPVARTITITKIDDTPADPLETVFYLIGDFNGWNTTANCFKRVNAGDNIAYTTITLTSTDNVEFKVFEYNTCGDKYYGNEGTIDENTTFSTWWSVSTDKDNCTLSPIVAGTYTFALNLSEKRIYVDFPKTTLTISGYEYATYYGATALIVPNGVEAYYVDGVNGEELNLVSILEIPAETGVILYAAGGGNYEFRQTASTADYSADNWLKGSLEAQTINNDLTHYVLSAEPIGMYYPKGTGNNGGVGAFVNGAGKAYLEIPADHGLAAAPRAYIFRRPQVPTGMDEVENTQDIHKFVLNGVLYIQKDGRLYNALGQIVK